MSVSRLPCVASPDDWFAFPGSKTEREAKTACAQECPVYWSCQEYALEEGIPNGVWGGLGEKDRQRIWKGQGGRPTKFDEVIDDAVRPLLQYRRDYEKAIEGAA